MDTAFDKGFFLSGSGRRVEHFRVSGVLMRRVEDCHWPLWSRANPVHIAWLSTGIYSCPFPASKSPQYFLYLNYDIASPSPTLAKAGDGAVHGVSTLWLDHAREQAGTASLHRLVQLIAAIKDRAPEGREHEAVEQFGPPIAPEPRKRAFRASESCRRRGIARGKRPRAASG